MRAAATLLVVLWIWAGCGGDDGPPGDAAAGGVVDSAGQAGGDAAGQDGDAGGLCSNSEDCGGQVCCDPGGPGAGCVPSFDDCAGLVLCDDIDECPEDLVCCPQGFCGGCD